jgi:hypothetical protein
MILFKLWIFDINFISILVFIIGLFFGAFLISLIFALIAVRSISDKKTIVKTEQDTLTDEQVKDMIFKAKETFKDKELRKKKEKAAFTRDICKDLAYMIAYSYYPNSRNPLLELSVDELIDLISYIRKRLDEILNKPVIKSLRKMKVSDIVRISMMSKDIISSKQFKVSVSLAKKTSKVTKVLSAINPLNIFKNYVVGIAINKIIDAICLSLISLVGEETYKIYSKKVLNIDVDINTVDDDINQLYTDLKEIDDKEEKEEIKEVQTVDNDLKLKERYFEGVSLNYQLLLDENIELKSRE